MIVTCERCQVRFNLDESLIKESGSKVRCSKCHHIFTAYKPESVEEISPPLTFEEALQDQREKSVQEPLTSEEAAEGLEGFSEESLDFDALESEGETEEEEFSLEDLGLEEDFALDEIEEPAEQAQPEEAGLTEDEMSVEDLGLEDEITSEEVSEPAEKSALDEELGDDFDLEDLDLDLEEAVTPEEAIPSAEDIGEEKAVTDEDEISLDDFQLEEEPLPESRGEEARVEEPEEDIFVEEPSGEERAAEGEGAEDESMWVESDEALEVEGHAPAEAMPFPSAEEAEEYEEEPFPSQMREEEPLPKKRISMPLLVLMIVVLVGGAAYGAYTILKSLDVKIPFLESLTGEPQVKEEGLKLLENLVTSGFLDSQTEGRLFVIKGEVRNDYPAPRNFMRVKGAIYLKDGNLLQEQIVYCGNVLPDDKLQSLEISVIQRVLNNRFGANKSNFRVPPGTALPFMIVFTNLPEELGEYSVEVVDSVAE